MLHLGADRIRQRIGVRQVQPEFLRLFKRGTQTIGTDTADDVASDAIWAELDALEGALV